MILQMLINVKCTEKMLGILFCLFVCCRMDDEQRLNMMDDDRQHMMRGGRPGMDQVSVGGRLSVLLKQPAPRGSYVYL